MYKNILTLILAFAASSPLTAQIKNERIHITRAEQVTNIAFKPTKCSPNLFVTSGDLSANFTILDGTKTETVWSEDFNDGADGWTLTNAESFSWQIKSISGDKKPTAEIDANDASSLFIEGHYRYADRGNADAVSPVVKVPRNAIFSGWVGYSLNFKSECYLKLFITDDAGATWTELWSSDEETGNAWQWFKFEIDLGAYAESDVQFKFHYGGNNGFDTKGYMGDFTIDGLQLSGAVDVSEVNVMTGDVIRFADTSEGNPTSWQWSFPGGTPSTSTEQNPQVYYTRDGEYDVTLTVSANGATSRKTKTAFVKVTGTAPTAQITPPATFRFSDTRLPLVAPLIPVSWKDVSTGFPTEWSWVFTGINPDDFTAATTINEQNPKVAYAVMHEQAAGLTATNQHGSSDALSNISVEYEGYITNMLEGDYATTFNLDGYGEFPGTNSFGIEEYAEKFSAPSVPAVIPGVTVYFVEATAEEVIDQIAGVKVAIYTSKDGLPDKQLDFASWSVFELDTPSGGTMVGTDFEFSQPVIVTDEFFVVISGIPEKNETCTVSFGMAEFRDHGNTAYFKKNGEWIACSDYFPAGANHTSYAIFPYLRHSVMSAFTNSDVKVGPAAGSFVFTLYSWMGYNDPKCSSEWCRVASAPSGYTIDDITIEYDKLPTSITQRTATITFSDGISEVVLTVTQDENGAVAIKAMPKAKLAPSIFTDNLCIYLPTDATSIEIYNAAGQAVMKTDVCGEAIKTIGTTSLSKGIYLIKVNSTTGSTILKGIKR